MTRETKIGLLVGLAFIIVIGILLGDHYSGLQKPQPAPLPQIGANVRNGAGMPGGNNTARAPLPADPVVDRQVPTTRDLTQMALARQVERDIGRGDVSVGPGGTRAPRAGEGVLPIPGERRADDRRAGDSREVTDLERRARAMGEELVPVPGPGDARDRRGDERRDAGGAGVAGAKTYKAESGDSLSKMAARLMGGNTKANREAIIKLNPSLQADPNKIEVGKIYNIPAVAAVVAPGPGAAPRTGDGRTGDGRTGDTRTGDARTGDTPAIARAPDAGAGGGAGRGEQSYTTKAGDTLWRIAVEQCGGASARAQIIALNKDVLANPDVIPVGIKLRLPGKVVAVAR